MKIDIVEGANLERKNKGLCLYRDQYGLKNRRIDNNQSMSEQVYISHSIQVYLSYHGYSAASQTIQRQLKQERRFSSHTIGHYHLCLYLIVCML